MINRFGFYYESGKRLNVEPTCLQQFCLAPQSDWSSWAVLSFGRLVGYKTLAVALSEPAPPPLFPRWARYAAAVLATGLVYATHLPLSSCAGHHQVSHHLLPFGRRSRCSWSCHLLLPLQWVGRRRRRSFVAAFAQPFSHHFAIARRSPPIPVTMPLFCHLLRELSPSMPSSPFAAGETLSPAVRMPRWSPPGPLTIKCRCHCTHAPHTPEQEQLCRRARRLPCS
jgi:hypothetical protein